MSVVPKRYQVLNGTITASGNSGNLNNLSNSPHAFLEAVLSCRGPVTGTSPSLLATVYAIDVVSGQKIILFQFTALTAVTTNPQRNVSQAVLEGQLYVDWVVTGTTPSFGQVNLDIYMTPDAFVV